MKIVFVSNFINHHQVPLADALYAEKGIEYYFIARKPLPDEFARSGYADFSDKPYLIKAYESNESMVNARNLIDNAEVVIIGAAPDEWVVNRLNENKVTFHYSERWFKTGYKSLLSPRAWLYWIKNHIRFRNKRSYMLCASAFTSSDVNKIFAYPNKCFKWGYFTKVTSFDIEKNLEASQDVSKLKILYVSRFLIWKHPEMPVELAKVLKAKGYNFEINMYGTGPELDRIRNLIQELDVQDCVNLKGNLPNDEILKEMRNHHIFLFPSDRNEGWGAVVNEAMSNGCVVVGGGKIGCVPFLINHSKNGLIFKDQDQADLNDKVIYLLEHPEERIQMSREAYRTMHEIWSPENAAKRFIKLAKSALEGNIIAEEQGPCSKA